MSFEFTQRNASALEPLFKAWEEPVLHRLPNSERGKPAVIAPGRRPSKIPPVRAIRAEVDGWRRGGCAGISDTSRFLLQHWFEAEHPISGPEGEQILFRYHWAQREAIETFIYLYELRRVRNLSELLFEFGNEELADLALGIPPEQDRWGRYCAKIATGAGKTKIMTLAIVWSYFHSIYEPNSDLARHFVLIAPNLTVYERLKDDFENCAVFYKDPLIPEEWKNDFQMQVVLQDEPGGATSHGAVYLTNIHRLYGTGAGPQAEKNESSPLFGPPVSRSRATDSSLSLRERVTAHPRLMVLNDEAHHLHDPELAWNRAVDALHEESLNRGGQGLSLQLDFTATPKHNDGTVFRHIVCDFPLGEAVDAGIVKVPVLGESDELIPGRDKKSPAHQRYAMHLQLGYQRYVRTHEELGKVCKPILFVMTEDASAANEITDYLDSDAFPLLKGCVLNIHTRLKGKIRNIRRGGREIKEFVENDAAMKPDDLRELREMSRELDSPDSKFRCVVSVMMLREGWDVRNVTTIVPLRPYSAKSGILPEQTLGRGLRRMFPSGEIPELVTVIEHPAFRKLYEDELAQEGVDIAVLPLREAFKQTVTIFADHRNKAVEDLEIEIPLISDAVESSAELKGLSFEEVCGYFRARFKPLPLGKKKKGAVEYRERHLFTDEVVAQMKLDAGLLTKAWSAPAYFTQMLGSVCRITHPHQSLAPLVERFIAEVLFGQTIDLYAGEADHRMRDQDVAEHIRAVFTPLILEKTVHEKKRTRISRGQKISEWKAYQAASNDRRPALPAERTLFNLVPCENEFEQAFSDFLDIAQDAAAFAKNAGPQKLMLDYLKPDGHRALYIPDFIVRSQNRVMYLAELKGRQDNLVPYKAAAAAEWCRAASTPKFRWQYLYVPYHLFQQSAAATIEELARACEPSLKTLLEEVKTRQLSLPLEQAAARSYEEDCFRDALAQAGIDRAPAETESLMRQAVLLLDHAVRSRQPGLAHAFQPLLRPLDEYALRILEKYLKPRLPAGTGQRYDFFNPDLSGLSNRDQTLLEKNQRYLHNNLEYGRSIQRLGTLLFCLDYAQKNRRDAGGIWQAVADIFSAPQFAGLYRCLNAINEFRNTRVAHVEQPLTDAAEARGMMHRWLFCLNNMVQAAA
jgi:type III restriction enzyme